MYGGWPTYPIFLGKIIDPKTKSQGFIDGQSEPTMYLTWGASYDYVIDEPQLS